MSKRKHMTNVCLCMVHSLLCLGQGSALRDGEYRRRGRSSFLGRTADFSAQPVTTEAFLGYPGAAMSRL